VQISLEKAKIYIGAWRLAAAAIHGVPVNSRWSFLNITLLFIFLVFDIAHELATNAPGKIFQETDGKVNYINQSMYQSASQTVG
jgi:hypothetical protein